MLNLLNLNLIYFWPWRMTLILTIYPLKICIFMRYICKPNMKSVSVMAQTLWPYVVKSVIWPIWIFDLKGWHRLNTSPFKRGGLMKYIHILNMEAIHWRMNKLEQLNLKVNLLTNMFSWPLTPNDETDFDESPFKMCRSIRYTCKSNMEAIHWRVKK